MKKSNKNLIQAFFDEHKNRPLEFIMVTDINMKEHPSYYKAIFKDIQLNRYYSYSLAPEMMHYKYKAGNIYVNGEYVGKNKSLMTGEFEVNRNANLPLIRLAKIINENDVKLIDYDDIEKFFLRQYAHVEVQEDCTLILPCYTIANRFYFLSSSLKQTVMNGSLSDLYYDGSFRVEKKSNGGTGVQIHIKKKSGTTYLAQICRFVGSSFSRKRFDYISTQKALLKKEHTYAPIKAQFPVQNIFKIKASYIYIGDDDRGKPKYLVLNIFSDSIGFPFQSIDYKIYKEGENPKGIDPNAIPVPQNPLYKPPRKNPKRNNKIYSATPLSEYTPSLHPNENNDDTFNNETVEMNGKAIYIGGGSEVNNENIDKKVGNSLEAANASGDENIAPMVFGNIPEVEKKPIELFKLYSFHEFYEALLTYAGIYGEELEDERYIKKINNIKRKNIKYKSICNRDEDTPRRFLFGEFLYGDKQVYITEIEQDLSWAPSTWIFVANCTTSHYSSDDIHDLIKFYIENDLTYIKFSDYAFKSKSLIFIHKDHKKGLVDELGVNRWCEGVLKKILNSETTIKSDKKIKKV